MSAPEASENTGLLRGPSTSTPTQDENDKLNILIGVLAGIAFLVANIGLPLFSYCAPAGAKPIFVINDENPTLFTIRHEFVILYWFMLLLLQLTYLSSFLCVTDNMGMRCQRAARLGIFFILHNIFIFIWAFLSIHSLFKWGELLLFLNFIQLCIGCGVHRGRVLGRWHRRERENPADQENQASQEAQYTYCRDWPVDTDEFSIINRLAVLFFPLTLTVYMLLWNIAIDLACQGGIFKIVAIATVLFLFVCGLALLSGPREFGVVVLALAFFGGGLLVQQLDNADKWYFWVILIIPVVTNILFVCVAVAWYARSSIEEFGCWIRAVLDRGS